LDGWNGILGVPRDALPTAVWCRYIADDPVLMCQKNAAVAAAFNRSDLVQVTYFVAVYLFIKSTRCCGTLSHFIQVLYFLNVYFCICRSSLKLQFGFFNPHHNTTYVDVAYCYSSMVCQSVTLVSPAKTAEPTFGLRIRVGPGNHVLDRGPDPPVGRGNVEGGRGGPL